MRQWLNSLYKVPHAIYLKIAEPRVIRIMQFGIYLCMVFSGGGILTHPPERYESILGTGLVFIFGGFVFIGGVLGAIAVLPGIWWLERTSLILLVTGMGLYALIIIGLKSSPMGIVVAVAFSLTFAQRWTEIRRFQLAPREE